MTRVRPEDVDVREGAGLSVLYVSHDTPIDVRLYLNGAPADMTVAGRTARWKLWRVDTGAELADKSLTRLAGDLEGGVENRMQATLLAAEISTAIDQVRWKVVILESGLTIMAGKPRASRIADGGPF